MNSIQKLEEIFKKFPGIGPRQAKRFVYYLLSKGAVELSTIATEINNLKSETMECQLCHKIFLRNKAHDPICEICRGPNRDKNILMIVARDADLEHVEKMHVFNGLYFILGNNLQVIEKEPEKRIRIRALIEYLNKGGVNEVILSLNATPDGETTAQYVEEKISQNTKNIKISHLAKGISTGTEVEYSDKETFKNALERRS